MNLDSGKTNPRINRLLLNPKGIFVILRDRVIPTIQVPTINKNGNENKQLFCDSTLQNTNDSGGQHRFWCKLFSQNTDSKKICLCELWAPLCHCWDTSEFSAHL